MLFSYNETVRETNGMIMFVLSLHIMSIFQEFDSFRT